MVKVAYIGAYLASYLAEEYKVFERSIKGLETLGESLSFELSATHTHISTREEARQAADNCEELGVDFVLLQNSSFAMGDLVLEFVNRSFKLGIWATEEATKEGPIPLNNFVSMNLQAGILTRYLSQQNIPFKWFYGYPEHPWFSKRLEPTIAALRAIKRLKSSNIALLGGIAATFYNFHYDESKLRNSLGVEVGHHELSELLALISQQSEVAVQQAARAMTTKVNGQIDLSTQDLNKSAAIYLALKAFAKTHNYDALAVSDWPVFQSQLNIHPGMAFSFLDDEDAIPVASEGDVMGAASMLLMNEISNQPSLLLDINDVDFELNAILMWHCGGSPLNFANKNGASWQNHSTLGRKTNNPPMGAVADYHFSEGDATIMRLSKDGTEIFVVTAEIINSPHKGFDGTRGWLSNFFNDEVAISLADLVNTIMVEGIEHHFILGKGRQKEAIHEFASWLGLNITKPIPYKNYLQIRNTTNSI